MVTDKNYKEQIQTYGWEQLGVLWKSIQNRNTQENNWASGKAFEYFILRAFELENAEVSYPYSVSMTTTSANTSDRDLEQIDGVVYTQGIACLIECKDTTKAINFEPIAKLRSQLMRRPSATIASIFSMAGFTEPAKILLGFIHPQTILTWEADDITYCIDNRKFCNSLVIKYRKAIEEGFYSFSTRGDLL